MKLASIAGAACLMCKDTKIFNISIVLNKKVLFLFNTTHKMNKNRRKRSCIRLGVSRSYRKLIRLRRVEDNGHYRHSPISSAIVRYLPLTSGEA